MNKVMLMGRFTRDPESRMSQNSLEVSRFSLACQSDFTNRNGERQTEFVNCVAFGNTAGTINRYFHKGDMIMAQGRIRNNSYDAQDGTKRYTTDVVIEQFEFTGGRSSSNSAGNYGDNSYSSNSNYSTPKDNSSAYSPEESSASSVESADISEDPYKSFGDEYTLSSDDLPF